MRLIFSAELVRLDEPKKRKNRKPVVHKKMHDGSIRTFILLGGLNRLGQAG